MANVQTFVCTCPSCQKLAPAVQETVDALHKALPDEVAGRMFANKPDYPGDTVDERENVRIEALIAALASETIRAHIHPMQVAQSVAETVVKVMGQQRGTGGAASIIPRGMVN